MGNSRYSSSIILAVIALCSVWEGPASGTPIPRPQVVPGRIPPHVATHPALSSVTNSKESALLQFAYNTQNRRGPAPSALVLQNQSGPQNEALVNQLNAQRSSGGQFLPGGAGVHAVGQHGAGGVGGHAHGHQHGNENPEQRALEFLQQAKNGQGPPPGQQGPGGPGGQPPYPAPNNYNPVAYRPSPDQLKYPPPGPPGAHAHTHGGGPHPDLGREDEGEDIKKLKSLLNLPPGPIGPNQGTPPPSFGTASVPPGAHGGPHDPHHGHSHGPSPNIGVAGQSGIINPGQYGHGHGHDHAHGHSHGQQPYPNSPTPFPQTASSQHSLGNSPYGQQQGAYGQGSRPYPGSTGGINVPYGSGGSQYPPQQQHQQHGHQHQHDYHQHSHGQVARTLIQSVESPPEAYQPLVYIDPVRDPQSINKHIDQSQSVFILPASDFTSDDFQRLLNRPAEILIDVLPADGNQSGASFGLHNFSLLLTPSTYARCAQASHKQGYGGKCKLILKVGGKQGLFGGRQPVQVSYKK